MLSDAGEKGELSSRARNIGEILLAFSILKGRHGDRCARGSAARL